MNFPLKKIIAATYLIFILVILITPINFISAQAPVTPVSPDTYKLLAPLKGVQGEVTDFDPAPDNALGTYLNLMIKVIIGLSAVMAVVMIVIGGMEYMTSELISSKEAGKERIRNALLGLLIALGAYALLFTINPNLLSTNVALNKAIIEVSVNDRLPQTPVNGRYTNRNITYTINETWAPRAGALADLTYSGATVYNSQCTRVGDAGCTSTRGLNPSALNSIRQGCPTCVLLITGGTEFWLHGGQTGSTSHQVLSSTVDLDPNPALNAYLSGGQPLVRNRRYPPPNGPYLYEGNHWHIG